MIALTKFAKGCQAVYTTAFGNEFTATVLIAHRDGTYTIRVCFPVHNGRRLAYGYQGDRYRVEPTMLAPRTTANVRPQKLELPA